MPLSYVFRRTLERGIGNTCALVYKKHTETRKVADEDIRNRLLEAVLKYLVPYVETLKMLKEKGLIASDWRANNIRFKSNPLLDELGVVNSTKIKELLGSEIHNMELDINEVVNDNVLIEDLKRRKEDNDRIRDICKNADKLAKEVANSYGTVKYLLTQFPELKEIFKSDYDAAWKPNPNYKVKPRSAFSNNDAFILLFGEAAMFGIKP